MDIIPSFLALGKGLRYCTQDPEIRKLAIKPWFVGAVGYFLSVVGAYYAHPRLLAALVDAPTSFWSSILYYLAWLGVAAVLVVVTLVASIAFVLIFASIFQTAIAAKVLVAQGREVPPETPGIHGIVKEAGRSMLVESLKLLWIVPVLMALLILGFIPFFTPFTFLIGSWLLAYQFVDIVLDVYKISVGRRLRFSARHGVLLTAFGATLTICWAIPFLGLLLPPAAVAGAAWLLTTTGALEEIK